MSALTPELRQALEQAGGSPVRLEDPETHKAYVILSVEAYERIQSLMDEEDRRMAEAMFPGIREAFADWDDPGMDVYNDLDPRR